MKNKRKKIEPIPEEFASYEEVAEFWDTHDTTDYPDAFQTVDVQAEFQKSHKVTKTPRKNKNFLLSFLVS